MPELRVPRFAVIPVQFDPTERTPEQHNAYQRARRRKTRSDAIPGGRTYRGGYPVQIRNGMPDFKPYRYRGAGHDIMECNCHA